LIIVLDTLFSEYAVRRLPEFDPPHDSPDAGAEADLTPLGEGRRGFAGVVARVETAEVAGELPAAEMERRLLEMGFVEGAKVEILHEGLFGGDPIAVKLDDMRVALRRRDARGVMVRAANGR
jgi:ferrous iron transport protein A